MSEWPNDEDVRKALDAYYGSTSDSPWGSRTQENMRTALLAGTEGLRAALWEAEETLRLVERPAFPDPVHHERVKRLGREIGFGALMSTASAGWQEVAAEKGYPVGGAFVAGPCLSTVQLTLAKIRATLPDCPNHIASVTDPKVCARCGVHIDDLRPPEDAP